MSVLAICFIATARLTLHVNEKLATMTDENRAVIVTGAGGLAAAGQFPRALPSAARLSLSRTSTRLVARTPFARSNAMEVARRSFALMCVSNHRFAIWCRSRRQPLVASAC